MKTLDKPGKNRVTEHPEPHTSFTPKTVLGKRLWELRRKSIAEAGKLLDWDELEKEIALRKGRSQKPTKPICRVTSLKVTTIRPS